MMRVLVAEGHTASAETMVGGLRRLGFKADGVHTAADALKMYRDADLMLLSLELPDFDGLRVCRAIRASADTPIIAVSSRETELDRVLALEAGADDCVLSSCGIFEVIARMEAVMRRASPRRRDPDSISLPPLSITREPREVRLAGRVVDVTAKEFELLYTLAANPDIVVSRKKLMLKVWKTDWLGSSRTIDTHINSLRKKLGSSSWIKTVYGVGYQLGQGAEADDTQA